jgi:putative ABC transport system permease protein
VQVLAASGCAAWKSHLPENAAGIFGGNALPADIRELYQKIGEHFVSYFVGAIMAVGATLGAINALYAMVDGRKFEIATLRAIGFGVGPVIAATLIEASMLAVTGGVLGSLAALLLINGTAVSPYGMSFRLAVTPGLTALAMGWVLIMGLVGGSLAALRSARVPVAGALRAV